MKRLAAALLCALAGAAFADHQEGGRIGSSGEVTVLARGETRPTLFEVRTEPAATGTGELSFFLYRRGSEGIVRRVVAPSEPGLYRLELDLPAPADWGLTLRYGTGLDLYYGYVEGNLDPQAGGEQRLRTVFRGGLREGVPAAVQPLGFAVFGLLAVVALLLIAAVLRQLARQPPGGATPMRP